MLRLIALLTVMAMLAGCVNGGHMGPIRADHVKITGFVGVTDDGAHYALVQPKKTRANYVNLESTLDPTVNKYTHIETGEILRLDVLQGDGTSSYQEYLAYVGPCEPGAEAEGEFVDTPVKAFLFYGWVYLVGHHPELGSDRVSAGAEGSKMLLQVDPDDDVHRVVLLGTSGKSAWATSERSSDHIDDWDTPNTYIEVDMDGNFSSIMDVATATNGIAEVVQTAQDVAATGP